MTSIKNIILLVKSKINPDSVKELSWVFIGQGFNVGLSFVIVKILSGMGPHDYGIYALVVTIAVFVGMTFYGPVAQGFIRFYYHYLEKSLSNIFSSLIYKILILSSAIFLIISFLFFVLSSFINFSEPALFFLIAGIYVVLAKLSEFFNSTLNLIRKRKENSLLQGAEKAFIIFLLFSLLQMNVLNLIYVFISLSVAALIFSSTKFFVFKKFLPKEIKKDSSFTKTTQFEMRTKLFIYISPFLIWGFSGWLQLNGEKWIINGLLTTADVGIYAVMLALVNALVIVPNNIISDFSSPIIFQQYADMSNKKNIDTGFHYIRLNMLIILFLTLFSTIITYLWGREIIILISSKNYTPYWYLLPLLCFGTGMFLTGQAQTVLGMALNLPKKYLVPKILIGILSIILNFALIKLIGINGVAYSVLLIGIFYVIYIAQVNRKIKLIFSSSMN